MGLETMRLHSYDEFQTWLARDVEVRDELTDMIGRELDIDPAGLDELEAFLLGRYDTPEAALRLSARGVIDAAARHVGLVLLLNVDGAQWAIELEDEDNAFYRLPLIRFADGGEECPLTLVTAALDRRTGDYLRTVVEGLQEQYGGGADA